MKIKQLLLIIILGTQLVACQNKKTMTKEQEAKEDAEFDKQENIRPNDIWPTNKNEYGYYYSVGGCSFPNNYAENAGSHFITDKGGVGFMQISNNSWGRATTDSGSHHSIPHAFVAQWFAVAENKFYKGAFNLPKDTIQNYFEEMWLRYNAHSLKYESYRYERFTDIIMGFAPKGVVVVWIQSSGGNALEIGRWKAEEVQVDWKDFSKYMHMGAGTSQEQFVALSAGDIKGPIPYGKADEYRVKYNWKPKIEYPFWDKNTERRKNFVLSYDLFMYNGEVESLYYEHNNKNIFKERGVPKRIILIWKSQKGVELVCEAVFKEEDIYKVYQSLSKTKDEELELVLKLENDDEIYSVVLRNKNSEVVLRTSEFEQWKLNELKLGGKPLIEE